MSIYAERIIAGSTDVSIPFELVNGSGDPITDALAADLTIKIANSPTSTPSTLTLSDLGSVSAPHSDGGLIHVVNGRYRLDLPDSAVAAAWNLIVSAEHADCKKNWIEPVVADTPTSLATTLAAILLDTGTDIPDLIAALNDYDGSDTSGVTALLARLTAARAAKLDLIAPGDITIVAAGDGQTTRISQRAGDTWTIPLTSLGDLSDATKLIFAIKASQSDADADALLTLDLDGLQRVNGAAYGTAAHGEIDIDDDAAGDITITVAAVAAELFGKRKAVWAIKRVTSAGAVQTLRSGTFETTESIIDATS